METKIDPEILKHLEEGLFFLDLVGASVRESSGVIKWTKKILCTFAYIIIPLFGALDIFHQEKEELVPTLAFHLCSMWAVIVAITMILQWHRTKNNLIQSMVRVRNKQLLIGEVEGKLLKIVSRELNIKKSFIAVLEWCLVGVILGGHIGWIIAIILETFKMDFNEAMVKKYPFPFPLWFPFDYTKTKTIYLLTGTFATSIFSVAGICALGTLSLFYSFTTFGTIHFTILNYFLKNIHKRATQKLKRETSTFKDKEYNKRMKEELKKCVIYLQEILSYCDLLESTYNTILLIETLGSGVAITGSLSMVVLTPKSDSKFISYATLLVGCLMQTLLFCFFGDRLTHEADSVQNALYFNKWMDANKSFRKSMGIIMTRMSKPVTITMGKISPVQLTTFIQILRAAYSFMALLIRSSNAAVTD